MLDALSSARALERARPSIAVLPIGSIEQHSHHRPLGTDWIAATALAHHVASALGAYLLPALPVSMGRCHKPMAGTVWVRPMTLADAVTDVVHSVLKSGIRNVVLINGHGGNFTLEVAVRELNAEPDGPVVLLPPMSLRAGSQPIFETAGREVHAGESETSVFLAIAPDLVGDQRVDHIPSVGREFLDYALIGQISPSGVWGKPSLASVEKGRRALDARVRSVVSWVRETLDAGARLRDLPAPRFAPGDGDGPTWLGWGPWDGSARGMLDYRATTFQVDAARPHTAILPVAAVEAHGPHLPIGCDLLVVEALTRRVADLLGPGVRAIPSSPSATSSPRPPCDSSTTSTRTSMPSGCNRWPRHRGLSARSSSPPATTSTPGRSRRRSCSPCARMRSVMAPSITCPRPRATCSTWCRSRPWRPPGCGADPVWPRAPKAMRP
jgi:creatinine amidohydrolase